MTGSASMSRQRRHAGADAGPRQRVLPHLPAVLVAIGVELARREAGDDRALPDGRRGRAEHAGDFQRRRLRPVGRAVGFLERIDLVVLAHHIDGAVGDASARRAAARRAGPATRAAVALVQRGDIAEAVGGVDPAVVVGDRRRRRATLRCPCRSASGSPTACAPVGASKARTAPQRVDRDRPGRWRRPAPPRAAPSGCCRARPGR